MNKRDSARAHRAQSRPGNSLLHALGPAQYRRLLAGLEQVTLTAGEVLHEPGVPIRYAYFPIDAVVALQTSAKGHHPLKVALVGHEGMVGIPLALGMQTSFRRALVQGTGTAMRMDSALLQERALASEPLQRALFQFKHALVAQIEQSAACKQFHSVQARLVRYLLMTAERARSNEIRLTQKFLADMLGVRRISVNIECSLLEKRALIKQDRAKITILDRKRLSAASCECFQIIKRIYDGAYESA